ncbi:MAG: PRTRC system protein E [Nevskiaceae bacterium]|nr:MAG: PRTRC system protein E [Nevskiaceae bacterium]
MFSSIDKLLATGETLAILVVKEADGRLRVTARPGGEWQNPVLGQGMSVVETGAVLDAEYGAALERYRIGRDSLKGQVDDRIAAMSAAEEAEKGAKAGAVQRIAKAGAKKPESSPLDKGAGEGTPQSEQLGGKGRGGEGDGTGDAASEGAAGKSLELF